MCIIVTIVEICESLVLILLVLKSLLISGFCFSVMFLTRGHLFVKRSKHTHLTKCPMLVPENATPNSPPPVYSVLPESSACLVPVVVITPPDGVVDNFATDCGQLGNSPSVPSPELLFPEWRCKLGNCPVLALPDFEPMVCGGKPLQDVFSFGTDSKVMEFMLSEW